MRIEISTRQIIKVNIFIIVIATISERVDGGNFAIGSIKLDFRYAPSIVGVFSDSCCILVNDSNYIALQVLDEVVGNIVVENTANAVLVVIIILLFAQNVNRSDDISFTVVNAEKLRTSN